MDTKEFQIKLAQAKLRKAAERHSISVKLAACCKAKQRRMRKKAEAREALVRLTKLADSRLGHEIAGSAIASAIPYVNGVGAIGSMLGSLNGRDLSDEELQKLMEKRENGMNYVPGVASYRVAQRNNALARKIVERAKELGVEKVRPTRHAFTESLGHVINPINWVASPIGALVAAARKHRTLDEQVSHDKKSVSLANLLVPGYAGYHSALRAGASRDVVEKKKSKNDNDDKKD